MKFETVLNAYVAASVDCSIDTVLHGAEAFEMVTKRERQATKFRAWLLAHAAQPCRPKRLEWAPYGVNFNAITPIGIYTVYHTDTMGWKAIIEHSRLDAFVEWIAKDKPTAADAMREAQLHFNRTWREMTEIQK